MQEYPDLGPHERQLMGARGDDVDLRIFWLVRHRLEARASANGGWDQLFVDPRDDRYWELTFPQGTLFGGGPRQLTALSPAEASAKYGV